MTKRMSSPIILVTYYCNMLTTFSVIENKYFNFSTNKQRKMPYLTQQAPAMTKARDPATMTTLLTTEKTYMKMVRGKNCCKGLLLSIDDIIPDCLSWTCGATGGFVRSRC